MITSGRSIQDAEFVPLTEDLLSSAARLSSAAGWNQTEEDWRRLLRLHPQSVRVWMDAGEVRASYSLAEYGGELGWIGMILTDPVYRGRGLGKRAFASALGLAGSSGYAKIGLDATEMGEPIYRQFGFERVGPITRWQGAMVPANRSGGVGTLCRGLSGRVLELDRQSAGVDRAGLLVDLARHAEVFRLEYHGRTVAYAAVRPGRFAWQIGPVVARSREDLEGLFSGLSCHLAGQPVLCDAVREDLAPVLQVYGLEPSRILQRMTLPVGQGCLRSEGIWLAAGFEWG